jgi:hypothetical protein
MIFTIRNLVLDVGTDRAGPGQCEHPTFQNPREFDTVEPEEPKPCGDDQPTFIPDCLAHSAEQCKADLSLQPDKTNLSAELGELKVQLSIELEEAV